AEAVAVDMERVAGHLARQAGEAMPALVLIQGPMGAGKRAVAHRLAAALGRPLAAISLRDVIDLQRRLGDATLMGQALTEARLRGAVPYVPGIEALTPTSSDA